MSFSNSQIVSFLGTRAGNAGFVDKLKIRYRPYICPFDRLLKYAEGRSSVFDIGCGSGQFCSILAQFTSVKKIMGIEINSRLVENAREINRDFERTHEIRFEEFDGDSIPVELGEYQLVYVIDVIHHVPVGKQLSFLRKIHDGMKPGAMLVFKDIDASSPFVLFNKLHDLVFSGEIGHELKFSPLRKELEAMGFQIVSEYRERVFVYPHYFYILIRK